MYISRVALNGIIHQVVIFSQFVNILVVAKCSKKEPDSDWECSKGKKIKALSPQFKVTHTMIPTHTGTPQLLFVYCSVLPSID